MTLTDLVITLVSGEGVVYSWRQPLVWARRGQ